MSHDALRLDRRKGDPAAPTAVPPFHGLHVVMSPSPAARASCRCGWRWAQMGRYGALAVVRAWESHRDACDGQTAAQPLGEVA